MDVQKLHIVMICEGTSVLRARSVTGRRGLKAGQFGGGVGGVDFGGGLGMECDFLGPIAMAGRIVSGCLRSVKNSILGSNAFLFVCTCAIII